MPDGWLQAKTDWDKYYAEFDRIFYGENSDGLQEAPEEAEEEEKEEKIA
jgi:hypothetical protein